MSSWDDFDDALRRAKAATLEAADGDDPEEQPCIECGRMIGAAGRWYSDGAGELVPYCAGCAEREFGDV